MNQAQWQVLQAMGIQAWQPVAAGEQRYPSGVSKAPTEPPRFLIVADLDDVQRQRNLLQSILNAVGWLPSDYLLLDDVAQLSAQQLSSLQCVWWCGASIDKALFTDTTSHIESANLTELGQDRQQKGALWQQLKAWQQPAP